MLDRPDPILTGCLEAPKIESAAPDYFRLASSLQYFACRLSVIPTNDRNPDFFKFLRSIRLVVFHVISPVKEIVTDNRLAKYCSLQVLKCAIT